MTLYLQCFNIRTQDSGIPPLESFMHVSRSPCQGNLELQDFKASISNQDFEEFKPLLSLPRIAPETFENTSGDASYGLSHSWIMEAKNRWLNDCDWYIVFYSPGVMSMEALKFGLIARCRRKTEDRINSFRNYKTSVTGDDGEQYEIQLLALQPQKANAIPVVLLHGWPGKFQSWHSRRDPAQMWCQRQVALLNSVCMLARIVSH
jgi:hypothetical protein